MSREQPNIPYKNMKTQMPVTLFAFHNSGSFLTVEGRLRRMSYMRASVVFALLSVLCLFLCPSTVMAGSFRALCWNSSISDVYYSPTGNEANLKKFSAFTHARSATYTTQDGVGEVHFFRQEQNTNGQTVPVEIAKASLAGAGSDPLIIFFENREKPGYFLTQVMNDSASSFSPGQFRFVNYAAVPVSVTLGDSQIRLEPKAINTISGKPRTIGSVANVLDVGVYTLSGVEPTQVFGNIWAFNPTLRNLVFIVSPPNLPDKVEVKRITDDPNHRLPSEVESASRSK